MRRQTLFRERVMANEKPLIALFVPALVLLWPWPAPVGSQSGESANIDLRQGVPCKDGGAVTFVNYCNGLHSAQITVTELVATELEFPEEAETDGPSGLGVLEGAMIGESYKSRHRRSEASKGLFGAAPPDLTTGSSAVVKTVVHLP